MKADLHAHTHFSRDALTSVETFARRYGQAGIDCVAVSDHNNVDGALAVREIAPFRVIISEEIRATEGEIIGFFLQESVPKGLTPEDTVRAIREQGGLVCVPHPFDRTRRSPLREEALLRILPNVDIIEVFNARNVFEADDEHARRFAEEHGKLMSAATDAHTPWEIGLAYVDMPPFEGPGDFLVALGKGKIVGKRSFVGFHLLSTWAKIKWRLHLGRRVAR
ncbi:MAG: PHP-associated domain-containing protein [Dehalococcoidia bacterium]|nr:PHP-associated domain-containing protein [Dehalococcoidia bacterium]